MCVFFAPQECCNSPYGNTYFPTYAEPIPGSTTENFARAAQENQVYLVAGQYIIIYVTHHAKRVPWVKIFDTGCLPDSGRVGLQFWEQYGVKILGIF